MSVHLVSIRLKVLSGNCQVTTEANSTSVDFLDVVLDLENDITGSFIKPNTNTKYVSVSSSHPKPILKSIPEAALHPHGPLEEKELSKRGCGVIWSNNIRTNVGGKLISLVRKHFPKSSPLHSYIFNTKKLKVYYKTTSNMATLIKSHNLEILFNNIVEDTIMGCNCRKGV